MKDNSITYYKNVNYLCKYDNNYRKFASSNTSHLEAHAGFFRFLMKKIFDPYVLRPFDKKLIS